MDSYNEPVVYSVDNINAKVTGATLIVTTENGTRKFYPYALIIESTAASTITIPASLSAGTNSASYNNIMAITAQTGLLTTGLHLVNNINTVISVVAANTGIYLNVTTAATGISQTFTAHLIGFYR